jgi:hypothetical protein
LEVLLPSCSCCVQVKNHDARANEHFKIRKTRYRATRKSPPNEATTNKPAPHDAAESGRMPAGEDKAMTTKPAHPADATASSRMPASEDEAMTNKPAPHDTTESGRIPAGKDKVTTTKEAGRHATRCDNQPNKRGATRGGGVMRGGGNAKKPENVTRRDNPTNGEE